MTPYEFQIVNQSRYENAETRALVMETARKIHKYFSEHENIMVSVSGGSDSDCIVHFVCRYFPEFLEKVHFVFVNTGLEYDATKRHLCDIENRYGITIERIRGVSVVTACRKYGFPILTKLKAHILSLYVRGFPSGEKFLHNSGNWHALQFTENQKRLAEYLRKNKILVSSKCCEISKKKPLHKYQKENRIDLTVTGERSAEGGQRALIHKSCFEEQKTGIHKYMPLWFWSDDVKADFKRAEGIKYSDCYEIWGLRRTGCVGCPFNQNIGAELVVIHKYEPKLFRACMNVFGESYRLMDQFGARRKKCLPEMEENEQ